MLQIIQTNIVHLIALFVAIDALLTIYMVRGGSMHEANPALNVLIARFGVIPTLLGTHAAFIAALYLWPVGATAHYLLLVFWVGLAAWNVGQIVRRNRSVP